MPLVALWLAASVLVMMAIVAGVDATVARARAQAAADAAALAGAADGRVAAQVVAELNDGTLQSYFEVQPSGRDAAGRSPATAIPPGHRGRSTQVMMVVTVVVEVDGSTARAAAERFVAPVGFP